MIEIQLWVKTGNRGGNVTATQVYAKPIFMEQVDAWRAFGFNADHREDDDDERGYVEVTGEARDLADELADLWNRMYNEKKRAEMNAYISNNKWPNFYRDRPAWEEYLTAMREAGSLSVLCRDVYNLCQYVIHDTAWDTNEEDEDDD